MSAATKTTATKTTPVGPAASSTLDLFAVPTTASSSTDRANGTRDGAGGRASRAACGANNDRLAALFRAAENARPSAWLAAQRGDWASARVEAERAAECFHAIAALAAEELVR